MLSHKFIKGAIQAEAKRLAERYSLDFNRTYGVMDRIVMEYKEDIFSINSSQKQKFDITLTNFFSDAFECLPPDQALTILETENLRKLEKRINLTDWLIYNSELLQHFEDLEFLTRSFISFLSAQREYILKTGLSQKNFQRFNWLSCRFATLYPTKTPIKIEATRDKNDNLKYIYSWSSHSYLLWPFDITRILKMVESPSKKILSAICTPKVEYNSKGEAFLLINKPLIIIEYEDLELKVVIELPLGEIENLENPKMTNFLISFDPPEEFPSNGKTIIANGEPLIVVNYEDAGIINSLTEEDAEHIEMERSKFFDLKISILEEIHRTILHPENGITLWNRCVKHLTETFSSMSYVDYYLMDETYLNLIPQEASESRDLLDFSFGGLTELFQVIKYYEKEINFGIFDHVRSILGNIVNIDWLGRPSLDFTNYFDAINLHGKNNMDRIIDSLQPLKAEEQKFERDFHYRFKSLCSEFKDEIYWKGKFKRKYADNAKQMMNNFVNALDSQFKNIDNLSSCIQLPSTQGKNGPLSGNYIFRYQDQDGLWDIVYEGRGFTIRDSKGLHYITYLLKKQGENCSALKLKREFDKIFPKPHETTYSTMCREELEEENLEIIPDSGDIGDILDDQAIKKLYESRQELNEDILEAKKNNDLGRIADLNEEMCWIEQQLSAGLDKYGRHRKFQDKRENCRKSISKEITKSLNKIKEKDQDQSLWRHLKNSIKTGTQCYYRPEKSIPWLF